MTAKKSLPVVKWPLKEIEDFVEEVAKEKEKEAETITIRVKKKDLARQAKRLCWLNLRKNSKICRGCPWRKPAIEILKELGWPLTKIF